MNFIQVMVEGKCVREQQKVCLPKLTKPAPSLLKYIEKHLCSQLPFSAWAF